MKAVKYLSFFCCIFGICMFGIIFLPDFLGTLGHVRAVGLRPPKHSPGVPPGVPPLVAESGGSRHRMVMHLVGRVIEYATLGPKFYIFSVLSPRIFFVL